MTGEVERLAGKLGLTRRQVESLRVKFVRRHGSKAAAKLEAHLTRLYQDTRDHVHLLGRSGGYVDVPVDETERAGVSGRRGYTIGTFDDAPEPEAVDEGWTRRFAQDAERDRSLTHAKPEARRQERSVARKVKLAVLEAERKGVDVTRELEAMHREIQAMRAA